MDRRKFLGVGLAAFAAIVTPGTDLMAIDFRTTKPKAWEVEKTVDGIKALYGNAGLKKSDKLTFKAPKLAENGGSIPTVVTIVGKERGTGVLYTASKEIDVSIGGCGG